jgi:ribonuclease Z
VGPDDHPGYQNGIDVATEDLSTLPLPEFAGGSGPITTTPVVGEPRREYAEAFVPGEELEDGELRVTVLGSGDPCVTRAQASGSILVKVGNPERDLFVLDLGTGSLANFASLKLPSSTRCSSPIFMPITRPT